MKSKFIFNNKDSHIDYGLSISEVKIGHPNVNTIYATVPFMNGVYDFTEIFGGNTYGNREITMTLFLDNLTDYSRTRLNIMYDAVKNWLFSSGQSTLKIDYVEHNFIGRVTSITEQQRFIDTESITVTFDCYPFRIAEHFEGHDIWDIFNFELDYAQDVKFDIDGTLEIRLYNPSAISVIPEIITTKALEIDFGGAAYKFEAGTTKDHRFKLNTGENNLILKGNTTVEFKFKKEVI